MKSCKQKPKYTCGDSKSNARCVFYDIDVPEYSNIAEEDCLTIEETTEDLYKLVSWIRESVNLDGDYDFECLEVDKVTDSYIKNSNRYLVKDVLKKVEEEVCNLKSALEEAGDGDNVVNKLDLKCLQEDLCGQPISSLKSLLQAMIDKICELQTRR